MTEHFIEDVIFDLADYFLCVVNDFTSLDQRYLDKLTRSLQNSKKARPSAQPCPGHSRAAIGLCWRAGIQRGDRRTQLQDHHGG